MTSAILAEILQESGLGSEAKKLLQKSLAEIEKIMEPAESVPKSRWLAVGHHLAEAIKRAERAERLEDIDDETVAEVEAIYIAQSKQVLAALNCLGTTISRQPEVILLAIHLQCASNGF